MLKVEFYKLLHSKNIFYIYLLVLLGAIYLGINLSNPEYADLIGLNINSSIEVTMLGNIFFESTTLFLTYFAIICALIINKDYSNNIFKVFIGTGINRKNILISKYIISMIICLSLIYLNGIISLSIINFRMHLNINFSLIKQILLYIFPYSAIISIIILISISSQSTIKSIIFNIILQIFLILTSEKLPLKIHPFDMLISITNNDITNTKYIIIFSLIISFISFTISYYIFKKQEL